MMRTTLRETLEKTGILVIDGSMSTALEQLGCDLNDRLWTAKALDQQPELVGRSTRTTSLPGRTAASLAAIRPRFQALWPRDTP